MSQEEITYYGSVVQKNFDQSQNQLQNGNKLAPKKKSWKTQRKNRFGNNAYNKQKNKFFYYDLYRKKTQQYQKNNQFSVDEKAIFEKLWKGAIFQTFRGRVPFKGNAQKKGCCCHCQCDVAGGAHHGEKNVQLRTAAGRKTMRSVVR